MVKILQVKEKVLRKIAKEVPVREIKSAKIKKVIKEMKSALKSQTDGVAIAAPQIGYSLRIFIVSGRVFKKELSDKKEPLPPDLVFINPELLKCSKKEGWAEEGCLSVRWLYGEVKRSEKATVRAYDEHGKLFTRGASGILAQVFQHEIEHLDGKLFTDKARNIQDIPPEKLKN